MFSEDAESKYVAVKKAEPSTTLVDLEVFTMKDFKPLHLLARKSGCLVEVLEVSLQAAAEPPEAVAPEGAVGGEEGPPRKKAKSLVERVVERNRVPTEGPEWRQDCLESADGRVRRVRPLLSLPWTPDNSLVVGDYLRRSVIIGYQEAGLMAFPSVSMSLRLLGLPPVAVALKEMEATPGNFAPGTRGHDSYFKLPADETDLDFGQRETDGEELPAPLTAEERGLRALKFQSLMACFHTTTYLLKEKKESLSDLCQLWAAVPRPPALEAPAAGGSSSSSSSSSAAGV